MIALPLSLVLMSVALLGLAALLVTRRVVSGRWRIGLLALLACLAWIGHAGLVRWDPTEGFGLFGSPPHANEFLHYYVGTKYFSELGYTGLYQATVVADMEDVPDDFEPRGVMRDLATYRLSYRERMVGEEGRVKSAFSPERWEQFKGDVRVLRDATPGAFWHETGWVSDHGYNGTPLTTAISGGVANLPTDDSAAFMDAAQHIDSYLFVSIAALVAGLEAVSAGLIFLVLLFANPMNDAVLVGSAYMRFDYFVALGLGLMALRGGWLAAAGALLAVAGWLRIFPLVFPALLLAGDIMARQRIARLRGHARLYLSFGVTSVVIFVASSWVEAPGGRNPWLAFAENMSLHSGMMAGNQIGLAVPFRYSSANDHGLDPDDPRAVHSGWREEAIRLEVERRFIRYLAATALVIFALVALCRGGERHVLFAGMLIIFALMPLAHYYYAVLSLAPLAVGARRRDLLLLTAALGALVVTSLPVWLRGSEDLRFSLMSAEILAYLLVACAWTSPEPGSGMEA